MIQCFMNKEDKSLIDVEHVETTGERCCHLCWRTPLKHRTFAGALTDPQLPAAASNVCTTDARLGGVGRVPHPQTKSWLRRWPGARRRPLLQTI